MQLESLTGTKGMSTLFLWAIVLVFYTDLSLNQVIDQDFDLCAEIYRLPWWSQMKFGRVRLHPSFWLTSRTSSWWGLSFLILMSKLTRHWNSRPTKLSSSQLKPSTIEGLPLHYSSVTCSVDLGNCSRSSESPYARPSMRFVQGLSAY